ncbi:MAG: valyl-tRNA synthetase [Patescibacteria group bacterium]|nr:valyl-tRNA synthetase [Patescibacteria group bacterium]
MNQGQGNYVKLSKAYEPGQYEETIYALWEKSQAFTPQSGNGKPSFSIVVPPPNANGNLHIGHGLTNAIEDILVRYHRMKGYNALLLPGADHAGFETQVVYEKHLAKEGKSRFDFTREQLYDQIYEFVAQNRDNYEAQFRKLGAGIDWSRFTFTLDQKIVDRAYATFKQMWDDKLIYRGKRLVNFCTFHGTAFADIEVAYQEDAGHLWHISYPLTDGSGEVVVATTRPETMLGDTAVAVHPDDKRYAKYIGKTIHLPLTKREIPIVADAMVEQTFGTGAVKITPAHDPNDYEVAQRHDLPMITVIDHEGKMTDVPEAYRGLSVTDARKQVVADLEAASLLVKTEAVKHSVGHCYKCGTVIEPLLREQWFVNMQPLVKPAIKALEDKQITFYPDNKRTQLISYLQGLRDWNISRQIAWGIPIPAFQNIDNEDDWIFDDRVKEELIVVEGKTYRRDPDVFDTWFSSSSWPYATLDFPEGADFKEFYPLSVMDTGADILYPWVSRMIMFGLYITGEVPFKNVYLHGLVLDQHGAKMSKSKGNVIDPITKVEEFGSDAFRMGVIAGQTAGNNQPYDETKVIGARNFCNKLWNVARFIEDKLGDKAVSTVPQPQTPADHWMLSKLQQSTEVIGLYLESFRLAEAYDTIYHLLWDDFADWYIEASKEAHNPSVLAYSLETILKLAHPFAPFVTETIWQTLAWQPDSLLTTSDWPEPVTANAKQAKDFEAIKTIVTEVRVMARALKTNDLELQHSGEAFLNDHAAQIAKLAKITAVSEAPGGQGVKLIQSTYPCWLNVSTEKAQAYLKELDDQQTQQASIVQQLKKRLGNKSYVDNAPEAIVKQTKEQLAEAERLLQGIQEQKQRFS